MTYDAPGLESGPAPELEPAEDLGRHLVAMLREIERLTTVPRIPDVGEELTAWLSPALGIWDVTVVRATRWGSVTVVDCHGQVHRTTTANCGPRGSIPSPICRRGQACHLHQTVIFESLSEVARVLEELPPTLGALMWPEPPSSRLEEVLRGDSRVPYAQSGTIIRKMLSSGVVAPPGRPAVDRLAVVMHPDAPCERPTPGTPYSEPPTKLADGREVAICRRSGLRQVLQCEQGHTGHRWLPCMRSDCSVCQPRVQRRRGDRLHAVIGGADLGHLVATLPPVLQELVGVEQLVELRQRWRQVIDEWARLWHRCEVGQVIACHPAGDQSPTTWMPHFDSVVSLVGRDLTTGDLFDLEWMRAAPELDMLRVLWAGQLLRALRLAGVGAADRVHHPQVWYGWRKHTDEAKVRHCLGYMARPFPAWHAGEGWDRRLGQARRYGLAGPQTKRLQITRWRATVAGHLEDVPTPCYVQDCTCHLAVISVGSWSWVHRQWPNAVDLDELGVQLV